MTIKQCIFNQIFKNLLTKVILLSELIKLRAHLIRMPSECPASAPSGHRNFSLALTLTLNEKSYSEISFKQIIIRF